MKRRMTQMQVSRVRRKLTRKDIAIICLIGFKVEHTLKKRSAGEGK